MNNCINKRKKVYLEFMRIIACMLVIFNHVDGYYLFGMSSGAAQIIYMILSVFTRINVPIFLMISGTLLLDRNDLWFDVFKSKALRIIGTLLFFDIIICVVNSIKYQIVITPIGFLRSFFSNSFNGSFPYWYLYAYIGMLLFLPFLQRIANGITNTEVLVLLVLHVVVETIIPISNLILTVNNKELISLCYAFTIPLALEKTIFYPLIGFYLDKRINIKTVSVQKVIAIVSLQFIGIFISITCVFKESNILGDYTQTYLSLFDYLTAIIAFVIIKYIFEQVCLNDIIADLIVKLGSLTFGVYMLDPILRLAVWDVYLEKVQKYFSIISYSIIWVIMSFGISSIITMLIKRLPILKKLV